MSSDDRSPRMQRATFLKLAAAMGAGLAGAAGGSADAQATMMRRAIPVSGESLPVVGLGTWQSFHVGTGEAERAPLVEVLEALFAAGGSVIDSSPMYGPAETVVGDLLARMDARERAFLATKVWTRGREAGLRQMQQSLERMRVSRMDLMQVHNLVDWRTQLATLRDWKESGRIRYLGVTHYTTGALDDLAAVIEEAAPDFVQLAYSIHVREAERRVLPLARERGVAVLVNRPFGGGGLFGRVRGEKLPGWAADLGIGSWAQFFLKFILGRQRAGRLRAAAGRGAARAHGGPAAVSLARRHADRARCTQPERVMRWRCAGGSSRGLPLRPARVPGARPPCRSCSAWCGDDAADRPAGWVRPDRSRPGRSSRVGGRVVGPRGPVRGTRRRSPGAP